MLRDDISKLEDSNIANYGSKMHHDAMHVSAESEAEWKGCGQREGIEVWRVENHKATADRPARFGVKKWPKAQYGQFFSGDSFIVLRTYKAAGEEELKYDIHFWLGVKTSQDEQGVAAYKTVELDELFRGTPVQYRELQGYESEKFMGLFKGSIKILDGGIESGFNIVKPEEFRPRLMHFQSAKGNHVRVAEVKLERASLNNADAFVLDLGLELIQWNGSGCSIREKRRAQEVIAETRTARNGRPKTRTLDEHDDDEPFWLHLGGKGPVGPPPTAQAEQKGYNPKLMRLSDGMGMLLRD